jgi:hypothetical protein
LRITGVVKLGRGIFALGAVSVQRLRLRRHNSKALGDAKDLKDVMVQAQHEDGEETFFDKFKALEIARLLIEKGGQCGEGGSTQWNCYCDLLQKARDVSQ